MQGRWIIHLLQHMRQKNLAKVEPAKSAEQQWRQTVLDVGAMGLFSKAKTSPYMGSNVDGKAVEILCFAGGLPLYQKICEDCAGKEYEGFMFA
jgi:hypothetical protein